MNFLFIIALSVRVHYEENVEFKIYFYCDDNSQEYFLYGICNMNYYFDTCHSLKPWEKCYTITAEKLPDYEAKPAYYQQCFPPRTPNATAAITPEITPWNTPKESPEITPEETPERTLLLITPGETPHITVETAPWETFEASPVKSPEDTPPQISPEQSPIQSPRITIPLPTFESAFYVEKIVEKKEIPIYVFIILGAILILLAVIIIILCLRRRKESSTSYSSSVSIEVNNDVVQAIEAGPDVFTINIWDDTDPFEDDFQVSDEYFDIMDA